MPFRTDVAIIGGGLCGTAVGQQCSKLGIDVVLLEQGTLGGGGATQHSGGIVRVFDHDPALMQWGLAGSSAWKNWSLPGPTPFRSCGMLYRLTSGTEQVRDAVRACSCADYPIEILDCRELSQRFPQLRTADPESVAVWEPRGGYCDPRLAARLFAESLRANGGTVLEHTRVREIGFGDGQVTLHTDGGAVLASLIVLATGRASRTLVAGLRVTTRTIPLSCFESPVLPFCFIDEIAGLYTRPASPRHFYCGGATQSDIADSQPVPEFSPDIHIEHRQKLTRALHGSFDDHVSGLMGADCYTRDNLPLLGFDTTHSRLCLATGFSGRGAKYIPAVAAQMAPSIAAQLRRLA